MTIAPPVEQQSFVAGTTVTFTATFRNALTQVISDPAVVACAYETEGGTSVNTIFGQGRIVKDAVGIYHLDIDTTGMAGVGLSVLLSVFWGGQGLINVIGDPVTVLIEGPPFAISFI